MQCKEQTLPNFFITPSGSLEKIDVCEKDLSQTRWIEKNRALQRFSQRTKSITKSYFQCVD